MLQRLLTIIALTAIHSSAAAEPTLQEKVDFFERRIRPVLVQRCYKCHSSKSKKPQGGLRVDSRSGLLRGGDTGPAIIPHKPQDSPLIDALHYGGDSFQMPPDGKLSRTVIRNFESWVKSGAVWPNNATSLPTPSGKAAYVISAKQRAHWSFQPLKPVAVRKVTGLKHPIDGFIQTKLSQHKLGLAPPAKKHELLRRATYDLTGLPPTPDELQSFLNDPSPHAFRRVIERLLTSPHHGERWARHWLDGVRYASDLGYYNFSDLGWRYRDWVIRSLNNDLPYDKFIVHQIAGDLLPPPPGQDIYKDGIIATGVMAMGNFDDQESNKEKLYAAIIDDQIDLVGRQFLALSLACARCHDHKFDPIPQIDYYSLGGIFMSSRVVRGVNNSAPRLRFSLDSPQQMKRREQHLHKIKDLKQQLKKLGQGKEDANRIAVLRQQLAKLEKTRIPNPGRAVGIADGPHGRGRHTKIGDMRIYIRGNPFRVGRVAPRRFPRILAGDKQRPLGERTKGSGRLELAHWIASPQNPLTARVMVNRVWQYHFGKGIVRTPSDFGSRGTPPTHPQLLDYLANFLIQKKWSLKALHRLIMTSRTYQQATRNPRAEAADADNQWWGRFNPRRLAAEEVHDALLLISGQLKRQLGQGNGNRAIYGRIGHQFASPFAVLFDAPATGTIVPQRYESTTAPQALFMLNDSFVIKASQALQKRLTAKRRTMEERIHAAYEILYARAPTSSERQAGLAFLARLPRHRRWNYYHVLICANEFMYLD